jgi:FAD/FMN-containing dehydrogenase
MTDLRAAVDDIAKTFCGRLLMPSDDGYDDARHVHNGMVDKHPALIAQCRGLADICDAVKLARARDLEIAVRGGGHNVAGRATVDGGVMVDLSPMRGVHVDPQARTARVEGGACWLDVNRATQVFGLATTGGAVSSTGVAGLTLGGGFGWLMAKYGMALDNVRSVEMVNADGEVVHASADENPDLFWGLRGGGGNFGVAGSFEFQLHEVGPTVVGGLIAYPFSEAANVLRFYRDFAASVPDEVFLVGALLTGPDGNRLAAIGAAHCGSVEDGEKALQPIKAFGSPVMDGIGPLPYTQLNMILDDAFPKGTRNYWKSHFMPGQYWKSHFMPGLEDAAIDTLVGSFERCPSPLSQVVLEHFHGLPTRIPPTETAYALRATGFNTLFVSLWPDSVDDDRNIRWTREAYADLQPYVGPSRYLNYMDHDDVDDAVLAAVYGPNVARLREVKAKYDPDNVFHLNLNVKPT